MCFVFFLFLSLVSSEPFGTDEGSSSRGLFEAKLLANDARDHLVFSKVEAEFGHAGTLLQFVYAPDASAKSVCAVELARPCQWARTCLPLRCVEQDKLCLAGPLTRPALRRFLEDATNTAANASFAQWLKDAHLKAYLGSTCKRVPPPKDFNEFLPYILRSEPVVFAGAYEEGFTNWSWPMLVSKIGADAKVWVKIMEHGNFEGSESLSKWSGDHSIPNEIREGLADDSVVIAVPHHHDTTFGEFKRLVQSERGSNASFYLEYFPARGVLETPVPEFSRELNLVHHNVWLGGATRARLHFDEFDNLYAVLHGRKTFRLRHPWANTALREGHLRQGQMEYDFLRDSFERRELPRSTSLVMSPLMSLPQPHTVCSLGKGDMLYLPAFHWHEVETQPSPQGFALAVNFWYRPVFNKEFPCSTCRPYLDLRVYRDILQRAWAKT